MADSNAAAERAEREERLASDLEEVEAKLNNCRENVETLMLQVKNTRDLEKSGLGRKLQLRLFCYSLSPRRAMLVT